MDIFKRDNPGRLPEKTNKNERRKTPSINKCEERKEK